MDVMSQARLLWQAWRNVEVRGGADSVENWSAELMEELQIVCQLVDNPTAIAPGKNRAIRPGMGVDSFGCGLAA